MEDFKIPWEEVKTMTILFQMPLDVSDMQEVYYQIRAIYERRHNLTLAEVQEIFGKVIMDPKDAQKLGWTSSEEFSLFSDVDEGVYCFKARFPKDISRELEKLKMGDPIEEAKKILINPISNSIIELEKLQYQLKDILRNIDVVIANLKEEKEKNK